MAIQRDASGNVMGRNCDSGGGESCLVCHLAIILACLNTDNDKSTVEVLSPEDWTRAQKLEELRERALRSALFNLALYLEEEIL